MSKYYLYLNVRNISLSALLIFLFSRFSLLVWLSHFTSLKSFVLGEFQMIPQFRTILAAKIKHTLSMCLCKKHRQFFRG